MRKLLCALSLVSALVFSLAVHAAAPTSFAGTWTLDKSKSQGLSQRFQNVESITWTVTQTDKTITIEEKMTGGGGPAVVAVSVLLPERCASGRRCSCGWARWWTRRRSGPWYGRRHGWTANFNLDGTKSAARRDAASS